MRVQKTFGFFAVVCVCAALLSAQGLTTTATKEDWEEINFEFNSSILSDGYPSLLRLAELLQQHPDYKVTLDGNADWIGSHRYNDKLSEVRGETVKKFLVKYGANENQILVVAHGKRQPKVGNETKEGRFMNRRVGVVIADGQGKTVSAGGIGEAIKAMQAAPAPEAQKHRECCDEILKRLDKLDEILAAVKELKAENDKLKQDVAALQQGQAGVQKQVAELPKAPEKAELQKMVDTTAAKALEKSRLSRFALLGVNIGPALNDSFPPATSKKGNIVLTGKGRFFAPFGKDESHAVQAEGEYMYYPDRQEGQFDLGIVNRWSNVQLGLFNSMKYIQMRELGGGGTLGQGALTLDYLFKYGRFGLFGTKGYLTEHVVARTPVQVMPGLTSYNVFDETYLRIVDQIGGSMTVGLWKDAYMDANLGALFRHGGANRPGGMIRLVQPINSMWAFTMEAGLNETMVGPTTTGRIAFGVQLGNWLKPKQFAEMKRAAPVEIPRLRYELLTRRVRTGNAPPVADAGPDQTGVAAGSITLDGSASYDPDGDAITYLWSQIAGPAVTLSSPATAKTTFTAAAGQTYSFRLTVKDTLGAQGTAKVTVVTQAIPQVKIVSFQANPSTIKAGQSAMLIWQTENAEQVTISSIGNVAKSGTTSVSPTTTTTYTLTASSTASGQQLTATVTITVNPVPKPVINSFSANPSSINTGQSSTLAWQVENADTVEITGLGQLNPKADTATVTPAQTTTYTLTARNTSGTATATVTVTVVQPQVKIQSFQANPSSINAGQSTMLIWQTTNADQVSISGVSGPLPTSGSTSVSPTATTTYTLTASNAYGQATAKVTVTVVPIPAPVIVNFSADPVSIRSGQNSTLAWQVQNADTVEITGLGQVDPKAGTQTVAPTETTTYTLTARNVTATIAATVTVTVTQPQPTILSFQANPTTINAGQSTMLIWQTKNADQVTISSLGAVAKSGTSSVSPTQTTTYTLTASNSFGQATATVTVTVIPVPPVPKPVIVNFSAEPVTINSGQSTTLAWQVKNAETVEITGLGQVDPRVGTQVVAPTQTTTYTLTASNVSGTATGTVTVTVVQPQVAILSFQANPSSITTGQSTMLIWQTKNADQVTISSLGAVAKSGTSSVSPTQTTTYTLTASNSFGQTTATVTVTVAPIPPPIILSFSASPLQIIGGGKSILVWQVQNATDVNITSLGKVGLAGSQDVSPATTTTYTLTATNAGGQVTATVTVTVILPAKITSFTAAPTTITAGDTVLLSWTTENAATISIYNIGAVTANGSLQVKPMVDTTYTLLVTGYTGLPSTAQVSVKVNPAPPTPRPPVANAGPNVQTNAPQVPLSALGSTDPNGLPLTYSWVSVNPTASLTNPTSPTPIALLGINRGDYVFTVTVTNSAGLSSSASVTVTYVEPL